MAAERKPGSNRGRAALDWDNKVFLFFYGLPPGQRDYQTVADEFAVSRRTVERHGREGRWRQRARELDRESARAAAERIRDKRAERLINAEKLIDGSLVAYAKQVVNGDIKLNPNHLVKLIDLSERLRALQDTETATQLEQDRKPTDTLDPTERQLQVLSALREAGAIDRLFRALKDGHQSGDENDRQDAEVA